MSRPDRIRAFTILELLTATAITSVLILVLALLGGTALDAWGSARSFARKQGAARAALDLLDSDLRSMMARRRLPGEAETSAPWLEVNIEESAGAKSAELSFFARATDIEPGWDGDLLALHYRLVDQDPIRPDAPDSDGRIIALYRAIADPEKTLNSALGSAELAEDFWTTQDVGDPTHLLAANVVVLSVEFWIRQNDGERRRIDRGSAEWFRLDRKLNLTWEGADTGAGPYRLAGIDLAVEVVSDQGMALIRSGAPVSEVPAAERRVFSQFVPVMPER